MAKQTRSSRQSRVISPQGRGDSIEQHESYDDSLLPDAGELARLQELDPDIMNWIKDRSAKEQDERILFNNRKISLIEGTARKAFAIDVLTILIAFLTIIAAMGFSAFLVYNNLKIEGTIFAGVVLLAIVNSFLNFRKVKDSPGRSKP